MILRTVYVDSERHNYSKTRAPFGECTVVFEIHVATSVVTVEMETLETEHHVFFFYPMDRLSV